jgi:hypothetical protein
MNAISRSAAKLTRLLASKAFFYGIIGFFVFEALWFVCSAIYPMAFDEDFHLGIIKIYAGQWSPFLTSHPAGADKFGAVVHDPSYLFHYLMSFPYRIVNIWSQSETVQVIVLRLINVGLFTWSLFLFRRLLLRAQTAPALIHTAMALVVLIPIVPQLAAHINYDNLLMVLVAGLCLATLRVVESFRQQRVDGVALGGLIIISLSMSIVKYAALPLVIAAFVFVGIMAFRCFRGKGKRLLFRLKDAYVRLGRWTRLALVAGILIFAGLFLQRYAVNLVVYGHPVPDCDKVLTVEQCSQYGPWGRDYGLGQSKAADFTPHLRHYVYEWLRGMHHRLFFAVNGPKANFNNYIELPVPSAAATIIVSIGFVALLWWWRAVFRYNATHVFFAMLIGTYLLILFYDQYGMYAKTSVPVAINGRYLLPVLFPLAALLGAAISAGLRQAKLPVLKPYLALAAIALFLQGGGILTFILRSDASWYWPNATVQQVNQHAQKVFAPLIIEGDKKANWH